MSIPQPNGKYMTATEVRNAICILTEADKKDVKEIMEALREVIINQLNSSKKQFTLHGAAKLVIKRRKARKSKMGRNPFTGEAIKLKARPACNVARGRALKSLKDAVA